MLPWAKRGTYRYFGPYVLDYTGDRWVLWQLPAEGAPLHEGKRLGSSATAEKADAMLQRHLGPLKILALSTRANPAVGWQQDPNSYRESWVLELSQRFSVVRQPNGKWWRPFYWDPQYKRWWSLGPLHGSREEAQAWVEETQLSDIERLALVARENPKRESFTPSYKADSETEYDRKVAKGRKRDLHVMVEGGRTGARYGQPPSHRTQETTEARQARWAVRERPWDARTQSKASHDVAHLPPSLRGKELGLVADGPELAVARGLRHYRESMPGGELGLVVPDRPWPLIAAGVPEKEAHILTSRAPRAFYPDLSGAAAVALVAPQASLLPQVTKEVGGLPFVRAREISVPGADKRGLGRLVEISIASPEGQSEVFATDEDLGEQINVFRERIERTRRYRHEEDGQRFIEELFQRLQQAADALRARWKAPAVVVELWFAGLNEPFEVVLSSAEHSKFPAAGVTRARVKYKNLQNVNLVDLPRLLVRLAKRKKRKGRRLQPTNARTNPVTTAAGQLEAFVLSEQEAGRLVPVPGKPGRVYWFSQRRKQLTETTESRARSWMAIAETGRASRGMLQQQARQAYLEEGLDRGRALPAPPPRQITTSPKIRENPMSNEDDYWFEQYRQGPYGARRTVPAARRNAGKRKKKGGKRKSSLEAKQAMKLAQQIARASGCDMSSALRQAWAQVKGGHQAAANPWYPGTPSLYLPDTTQTFSSLVPAPYDDYQDLTSRRSALVPGPYGRHNPGQVQIAKNGQPYVRLPNGKTRFISKAEAASMGVPASAMRNPPTRKAKVKHAKRSTAAAKRHAARKGAAGGHFRRQDPINYRRGQFSVTETGGWQPVNRRNPKQGDAAKAMRLYHSGKASSLKEAWKMVKGKAKTNGRKRKSKKRR